MLIVAPKHSFFASAFFLLAAAILLSACATPESRPIPAEAPPPVPAAPAAPAATPQPDPAPTPRATPLPTPSPVPERLTAPLLATPTPTPEASADPGQVSAVRGMVKNGELSRSVGNMLVFSRSPAVQIPPSSLFEDAIVLGRLRSQLNKIQDLPAEVSESATVRNSSADLTIPDSLPDRTAADAIDAALRTEGVSQVQARF